MDCRTTRHSMTFSKAFAIDGVERMQPAGTYLVEFDEEAIDGISFLAYRHTATRLLLAVDPTKPGVTEIIDVPSAEFAELSRLANGEEQPGSGGK